MQLDGRSRARRDSRRLRADRERRPAQRPDGAALHRASTSARRALPGAGCACAARPATARCRSRPTTRSMTGGRRRPAPRATTGPRRGSTSCGATTVETLGVDDESKRQAARPSTASTTCSWRLPSRGHGRRTSTPAPTPRSRATRRRRRPRDEDQRHPRLRRDRASTSARCPARTHDDVTAHLASRARRSAPTRSRSR